MVIEFVLCIRGCSKLPYTCGFVRATQESDLLGAAPCLEAEWSLQVFKTPGLSILKKSAMAMVSSLQQPREERPFDPFGFDQAKIFSHSRQCAPRVISLLNLQ
jgi:hypothetical protein